MASQILLRNSTATAVTFTSLASLATASTNGGAQSLKTDLGETRAQQMLVRLQAAFLAAPTAGGAVEVYVGFSSASVTNSSNAVGLSGVDSAYTGYLTNQLFQDKRQLTFVGVLSAANVSYAGALQVCDVGTFTPMQQYCQIVVVNTASQPLYTSSNTVTIIPIVDEAQ